LGHGSLRQLHLRQLHLHLHLRRLHIEHLQRLVIQGHRHRLRNLRHHVMGHLHRQLWHLLLELRRLLDILALRRHVRLHSSPPALAVRHLLSATPHLLAIAPDRILVLHGSAVRICLLREEAWSSDCWCCAPVVLHSLWHQSGIKSSLEGATTTRTQPLPVAPPEVAVRNYWGSGSWWLPLLLRCMVRRSWHQRGRR